MSRWFENLGTLNRRRREERLGRTGSDLERRYPIALAVYGALAVLVWFTIGDGAVQLFGRPVEVRWVVLFILAMFVFRTVMAMQADRIRRGVKPFDTSVRSRRWAGSSIARNDIVFDACGPRDTGSSDTPSRLDSEVLLRKPCHTSWCRDKAQKFSSSLRYSGASSRNLL